MLKYKVGQPIVTRESKYKGVIISVKEHAGILAPYEIKLENGDLVVCHDEGIQLDGDVLQAENERLKAALEKLLMVSHYTSDAHPKQGIECKRCAQWGITRADVIHLDWCEVGGAKDMLRSEAK